MIYPYPSNTSSLIIQYHRTKQGFNWILMYYKNIATVCMNVQDIKTRLGPAKFLDSSKRIYEWVEEMIATYDKDTTTDDDGRADTSFASEPMVI